MPRWPALPPRSWPPSAARRRVRVHAASYCAGVVLSFLVLGGGLLGLEAARAMRRFNTDITLVEHSDRLMSRQLDTTAAALLHEQVRALGRKVIVAVGALALALKRNGYTFTKTK